MPSILNKADRRVLRYFRKYGWNQNVTLTLLIIESGSTSNIAVELEQFCMDTLKPNLNVDLVASSTGYHEPMSEYWCNYFRKMPHGGGIKVFIYDTSTNQLIFISDSITYLADCIGIHRNTVLRYTSSGDLYLNKFLISFDPIIEMENTLNILDSSNFKTLLESVRKEHHNSLVQPASKSILAENVLDPSKTKIYSSITNFSKAIGGDRGTIRNYLNSNQVEKLYRKEWKLSVINSAAVNKENKD